MKKADVYNDYDDESINEFAAHQFDSRVIFPAERGEKDTLVYYFSKDCQYCTKFNPQMELVYKVLILNEDLQVLKYDVNTNDVPNDENYSTPSLYYFSKKDPHTPIPYNGDLELDKIIEFVKK